MVLLTLNEEANIEACLRSLASQTSREFEVIVIDSASRDRTVAIAQSMVKEFPVPLRVQSSHRHLDIGEARNRGVALAHASRIAFLSVDLEVDARWVHEALRSLETHDMVFGTQVHTPRRWTLGAAVRGLRYRFPRGPTANALPYASNVGAAYQKRLLLKFPFDPWANAAEDLLLARRAVKAGASAMYNPHMIVRHLDVGTARAEWRKNAREGAGWAHYSKELGLLGSVLAWGLGLLFALFLLVVPNDVLRISSLFRFATLPAVLWLPAARRGLRRHRRMPVLQRLRGIAASPAFDLAFLAHYLWALVARRRARRPIVENPQ